VTERTIVADEVTCPKCFSKNVKTTGKFQDPGSPIMYIARCNKGHKLAYSYCSKIVAWASESTEVQSEQ